MVDYKPKPMKVGILTAALQELTDRGVRDADPDKAIEDWIVYAKNELDVNRIQLSSALHPSVADVPQEAMLDPVANHLDLREPFNETRARRVQAALSKHGVEISDIGYFDDMIHGNSEIRQKKYDFMIRVMDAAQMLGVKAICGFVGRNQKHDMDQNLEDFAQNFVPLLKAAKERGLVYRVEQCPMPGWNTTDTSQNNIAYAPGLWIALHKIADQNKVGDQFRIHYDPSHAVLMGQNTREIFQYLKDQEYGFLIDGFHVKGQVIDTEAIAAWGYWGKCIQRGDRKDGKPAEDPRAQLGAWSVMPCAHELPGSAKYDPIAALQNRTVDWFDHQLAARQILDLDPANTELVVEHEYGPARKQDKAIVTPMLKASIDYVRNIDRAAAAMYAMQNEVMPALALKVQEVKRL